VNKTMSTGPGHRHFKGGTVVLAGDIGGTKTNLGLFLRGRTRPISKVIETYSSREAPNLETMIAWFLNRHQESITSAYFGIAGPVVNGRCKTTNLPWEVTEARIKRRFKWSHVRLLNDLTATAQAIPLLNSREFLSLNKARAQKGQNIVLVAPGTGLGEALLIWRNEKYIPIASEGGHLDFSPNNDLEVELWRHLRRHYGHVSVERVLSGPGLVNIYSWLKESGRFQEPAWLARMIQEMDPPRAITKAALDNTHPICVETLNMFISILGAVAGNLALTGMATAGVYLGGGIPPKILPKLREGIFMKAFTNKGRFKAFMNKIPVRVILNDEAALLGAADCAFKPLDIPYKA
jgi:glucokinase